MTAEEEEKLEDTGLFPFDDFEHTGDKVAAIREKDVDRLQQFYNSHGIDNRGLIEKKLAIDEKEKHKI